MQIRTLFFWSSLFFLAACSKPSELGLSLVEQDPANIIYTDSLSLDLQTVLTDPLTSSARTRWVCGSYLDPIFGQTEAGVYANFRLTSSNASFPNASFDSLVLSLAYDSVGHYGGNISQLGLQEWQVYRLAEDIDPDEDYSADAEFLTGDLLADFSFIPKVNELVSVDDAALDPQLRIRLADSLGQYLMQPDSAIYSSNSVFKEAFKGVYIRPKTNGQQSAILRFLSESAYSKLTLYYTDSAGVAQSYDYLMDDDAESVLNISHNYSNTTVLQNNSSDSIVYLQGMNGLGVRLAFPHLANLGAIVVNKAELVIQLAEEQDRNFPAPDQLFCLEKTSTDGYLLIDDVTSSVNLNPSNPFLLFGGLLSYDEDQAYFAMNLSEYLQRLVDQETEEAALYIQTAAITDTERMRIGNGQASSLQAKLFLTYTKID
ncbi:hypothetical protein SapgrDRAFT_1305 [Saprospira grandis DSM 2844]|uniref:DUF4270 family protein n=1 Tax=Saprospira grandis DSM 2844 TaxID=694433 RepID=J1I3V9_9BACT|nr:DUF4270 family protein [Saprospira grandis]EJF53023.1 hypothetical protein SapgrDRAFT_1305 [Saprospira grandis DSM 2844]